MSCFIFNLIAIEDSAQIQTFPHIKRRRSLRLCVRSQFRMLCSVLMMVEKRKTSSFFFSEILLRYCDTNWTSTYLICKTFSRLNFYFYFSQSFSCELLNILKLFRYVIFNIAIKFTDEGNL
jgi:hypothetical protein